MSGHRLPFRCVNGDFDVDAHARTCTLTTTAGNPGDAAPADEVTTHHRYRIDHEFARGGLGRILAARDEHLDRPVAVKELLSSDHHQRRRFEREAAITARLEHPAIVPIHDAGHWENGAPYYVMKLLSGGRTLKEAIAESATLESRLALLPTVIAVADAIAYAHSVGIIHRDLKPSNVVVGPFGETVVIDWGLAKELAVETDVLDELDPGPYRSSTTAGMTLVGAVIGTPQYMAPEQARGEPVDKRADVYSIGAMLYHLLAGTAPFAGPIDEILERVRQHRVVPLSRRHKGIPPDLIAVVEKAMAADPAFRYCDAQELVDDLKRFHTGQLVAAQVYKRRDLFGRWLRRHRLPVSVVTAICFTLCTIGTVAIRRVLLHSAEAHRARAIADEQRSLAEARSRRLLLLQARTSLDHDPTATIAWLKTDSHNTEDWPVVRNLVSEAEERGIARHVLRDDAKVLAVAFSPDRRILATGGLSRKIHFWNSATGALLRSFDAGAATSVLAFSPRGTTLAAASYQTGSLRLWGLNGDAPIVLSSHTAGVVGLAFSPDGRSLASGGSDRTVRLWDLATLTSKIVAVHRAGVTAVHFSPSGRWLAAASADRTISLLDTRTGDKSVIRENRGSVTSLAFSPDERWLLSGSEDHTVRILDLETRASRIIHRHDATVTSVAFDRTGRWYAASGGATAWLARVGDVGGESLPAHTAPIRSILFSPGADILASASYDGTIRLHDLDTHHDQILKGHGSMIADATFSNDGSMLASASDDETARIWPVTLPAGRTFDGHQRVIYSVTFDPRGPRILTASEDRTVRLWGLDGRSAVFRGNDDDVYGAIFSPDGRWIASAGFDDAVRLWNVETGQMSVLHGNHAVVWAVAFSPDGRTLASAAGDGRVRLWDLTTHRSRELVTDAKAVYSIAFGPDGRSLVSAGESPIIDLWNVQTGALKRLVGHVGIVDTVSFSPDGQRLVSASWDRTVRLWSLATLQSRILVTHRDNARTALFSPDGSRVLSAGRDGVIRLTTLRDGRTVELVGHEGEVRRIAFSHDGRYAASAGHDSTVRLWDLRTLGSVVVHRHEGWAMDVAFSPDDRLLASVGADARVWMTDLASYASQFPPAAHSEFNRWTAELTTAHFDAAGNLSSN